MKRSEDRSYRRGAVVGLTTAELFMLTSFMLIIALLVSEATLPEAGAKPDTPGVNEAKSRAALKLEVDRLTAKSENLSKALTDSRKAEEEAQEKLHQTRLTLRTEEKKRRQAETDADEAVAAAEAAEKERDRTQTDARKQVAEAKAAAAKAERVAKAMTERAARTEAQAREAEREAEKESRAAASSRKALEEANREIAALKGEKGKPSPVSSERPAREYERGSNPPCWYTMARRADGMPREKPLYLLDVAIHDAHLLFGRREPPKGGPHDEPGSYEREFEKFGAHRLPYGKPLTNREAREALREITRMGRESEIRSYACTSYAKVWDFTSPTAKRRWREAYEGVITQHLGAYIVQNVREVPWVH